jgi:hypothetical protein
MFHHADDRRELHEVIGFCRDQWVFFEERDDHARQIGKLPYRETAQSLAMIVVPDMKSDVTTREVLLHSMQRIEAPFSLYHCERRLNLPTDPCRMVPKDRNAEAAFAVDEADDPLRETWPFLLIVRTGRVFTSHAVTLRTGCDMSEYRRILGVSSIWPASLCKITLARGNPRARFRGVYLRTVIVTAAVYRGLGSELRPKTNPSP